MSADTKKPHEKELKILFLVGITIIASGFGWYLLSSGEGLPQTKDTFNKFDHFRFEPEYVFIEAGRSQSASDLGQQPKKYLTIDFYRKVDSVFMKAMSETYKDKDGKMISIVTLSNSTDSMVWLAIRDSEFVNVEPFSLVEWNHVIEFAKMDIDKDGIMEDVFKLDISDARDYYQLPEKENDYAIVKLFIPIKYNFIGV